MALRCATSSARRRSMESRNPLSSGTLAQFHSWRCFGMPEVRFPYQMGIASADEPGGDLRFPLRPSLKTKLSNDGIEIALESTLDTGSDCCRFPLQVGI